MLVVNGKQFLTLNDPIYVNKKKVLEVWANGVQVYPAYTNYYNGFSDYSLVIPFRNEKIWFNEIESGYGSAPHHCDTVFLYIKNSAGFDIQKAAVYMGEGNNFWFYVKSAMGGNISSYPSVTYRYGGEGELFIYSREKDTPLPRTFSYPEHSLNNLVETYSENGTPYSIYKSSNAISLTDSFYAFEPVSRMDAAVWMYEYFRGYFVYAKNIGDAIKWINEKIDARTGADQSLGVVKVSVNYNGYDTYYSNTGYIVTGDPCGITPMDGSLPMSHDVLDFGGMYSNGIEVFRSEADAIAYLKS